jgi:hypothetical protein
MLAHDTINILISVQVGIMAEAEAPEAGPAAAAPRAMAKPAPRVSIRKKRAMR